MSEYGQVVDHPERRQFELEVDGQIAFAMYQLQPGRIVFTHVETPPSLRGRGVATALATGALEIARERRLEVVAHCPFMAAHIRLHPEQVGTATQR
jgi:predicted GNAT family acetyltransferase